MNTAILRERGPFWSSLVSDHAYATPVLPGRGEAVPSVLSATLRYHIGVNWHLLVCCLDAMTGRFDRIRCATLCLDILRSMERSGLNLRVVGLQHVEPAAAGESRGVVIVANHMSSMETLVLPAMVLAFRDVTFVVKESLMHYPVFGPIIRALEPIAVSRRDARKDLATVLSVGTEMLKAGRSVVVFPQATRMQIFDPRSFNSLGVKLAASAGVPAIPLAIKTDCVGNGRVLKDFGRIDPSRRAFMEFGPPVQVEGRPKEAQSHIVRFITGKLEQWGATVVR